LFPPEEIPSRACKTDLDFGHYNDTEVDTKMKTQNFYNAQEEPFSKMAGFRCFDEPVTMYGN